MGRRHSEETVLRSLRKNPDVRVDASSKLVSVKKDATHVGNGTWGKIDFLIHYCDYVVNRVANIVKPKTYIKETSDTDVVVKDKVNIRSRKSNGFSLVNESKKAMSNQSKLK